MPHRSTVGAVLAMLDALPSNLFPGSVRPPAYLDEAPPTDAAGQPVRPPYLILKDTGTAEPDAGTETNLMEAGGFELTAYDNSLADVDQAVYAVRWGGQAPDARAGLDFAALDLLAPRHPLAVSAPAERRFYAGLDREGLRTHACSLTYRTAAYIRGDGT